MQLGEIILMSTMGITALVSAVFSLYMLKVTIWSEPAGAAAPRAEGELSLIHIFFGALFEGAPRESGVREF